MTVLQQIRNYYTHLVPNPQIAKKLAERLLSTDGVKTHPTPEDYFAERGQRLDENDKTNGRLVSERV